MDQNQTLQPPLDKLLRRRLSRIGWGLLLYFLAAQVIGAALLLIPGVQSNLYLTLAVNEAAIYGLAPLVLWLMLRPLPRGRAPGLPLSPRALGRTAVCALGTAYLFNLFTLVLMLAVELLTGRSTGNLLEGLTDATPTWLYLVIAGVIAPVMEELIFRRLLLDRLRPFGDRCAILVSGAAFGLFHMNLYQFFYAAALGMLFAGVVVKTGRLRHAIALHATVNLTSLVLSELAVLEDWVSMAQGVLILVLIGLTVYFLCRYAPTYRFAPPAPPVTGRQVAAALLRAPGAWVCALLTLALSVAVVFLV